MKRIPKVKEKNRVFVTVPDCRCQDTARPTSRSSSRENQWGQHGILPKSWSGSAVLALGGNSSCSKPAGTPGQGISWNTQGNYAIRTNPLHLSVPTMGGQRERIFCVTPMLVQQSFDLFHQISALCAPLLQKALSQTNQVFCSLTPGWAVSALAGPLWFSSPRGV